MPEINDLQTVKEAESALDLLFDQYVVATPGEQWIMEPAITQASEKLLTARLSLFKEGVLTTPEDLQTLDSIKKEIEDAADTQALIMGALKLAAFLGMFA